MEITGDFTNPGLNAWHMIHSLTLLSTPRY